MELEIRKATLLRALLRCDVDFRHRMQHKLLVQRASTGEISVRAAQALDAQELILVPMVASTAFIGLSSKQGLPLQAVPVVGFGVRPPSPLRNHVKKRKSPQMADQTDDALPTADRSSEAKTHDLVILPCTRLPPRGVELHLHDKPVFLHPFWAMQRSSILEEANIDMQEITFDIVDSIVKGEKKDAGRMAPQHERVNIPVAVNVEPLAEGDALIMPMARVEKIQRGAKPVTWDMQKTHKEERKLRTQISDTL
jgi:hypothetical protein